jgi:hypothetical protein
VRLAAQAKLGFYAAHEDAVAAICRHLERGPIRGDEAREFNVLDPCAGEGLALRQIAAHLDIPAENTFAIELDAGRAAKVRNNIPGARVLGPASFHATRITGRSFGLVYCNPPFDDILGGGQREEYKFAEGVTKLLKPGGILVLVMPITAIRSNGDFKQFLDEHYEAADLLDFPAHVRPFREVVYFGKKRSSAASVNNEHLTHLALGRFSEGVGRVVGEAPGVWPVPWSRPPAQFAKSGLTEEELERAVARSPINRRLAPPPPDHSRRPPADLSSGHTALQLGAGELDGVNYPEDEPPHVVRGIDRKDEFQSKAPVTNVNDAGKITSIVEKRKERITLLIRAVGPDGVIHSFTNGPAGETLEVEEEEDSE